MKKTYLAPAAELICLAPQESISTLNNSWTWNSDLQNYWGASKNQKASVNGKWYDFGTGELN